MLTAVFYSQMLKFVNILKIITFLLVYVNISCIFTSELKTTTKKIEIMKNLLKALLVLSILSLIILGFAKSPKGKDYIKWERNMIESNQMNVNDSEYFIKVDGVLKLK